MPAVKLTQRHLSQLGSIAALNPNLSANAVVSFLNESGLSKLENAQIMGDASSIVVTSNGKLVSRLNITDQVLLNKRRASNE